MTTDPQSTNDIELLAAHLDHALGVITRLAKAVRRTANHLRIVAELLDAIDDSATPSMDDEVVFTVGGVPYRTTPRRFAENLSGVSPKSIRTYWVEISGQRYPAIQAVAIGLGAMRATVLTHHALSILRALGFTPREGEGPPSG